MYDRDSEEFQQLIEIPLNKLFNVSGAAKQYGKWATSGPKAAYGAASGGLKAAGTKAASLVGASPATAAKIGAAAGSPVGVGLAGAAVAAIVYAGYKVYKKHLTQIGKACGGTPNVKACELKYHISGKKAQIKAMTDTAEYKCKTRECYGTVDLKIRTLQKEIDQLQAKLHKIPAPKRPESERREDEVFRGNKPATQTRDATANS